MMNDLEWRLRHLEELALLLGREAAVMKPAIAKLMQDEEMFTQGPIETGPPPPNCTFSGTIRGCNSLAYPLAAVSILDGGGNTLWSGAANASGVYSGSAAIPSSPTTVTLQAGTNPSDTNGARFATTSSSRTLVTGANALAALALNPATGYACLPNTVGTALLYPIKTTLHGTDPVFGAFTLTYGANGLSTSWSAATNPAFGGCPSGFCTSPVNPIGFGYDFSQVSTGGFRVRYLRDSFTGCAVTDSGNVITHSQTNVVTWTTNLNNFTSTSSLPLLLQATFANSQAVAPYCSTTRTINITE